MNDFKKGGKGGFRNGNSQRGNKGGRPAFNSNSRFKGRGGSFSGNREGGRSSGPAEMHSAVCAECKQRCEVPFKPTGDKPVYCRNCFRKQDFVPGRNSNGSDGPVRNAPVREQNSNSDARPQVTRTYTADGFESLQRQIIALESKVSRILDLVSKSYVPAPVLVTPTPQVFESIPAQAPKAKAKATAVKAKAAPKKATKKAKK